MGSDNDQSCTSGNGVAVSGAKAACSNRPTGSLEQDSCPQGRSGRGFVIVVGFWIVGITLALMILFGHWRSTHQELTSYGQNRVATAIDPLARCVPPALDSESWGAIVAQVRTLLVDLTASGALDLAQMRSLRRDIQERINGVRPETAAMALSGLWNSLEDQAGPVLTTRARFGLASTIRPLAELQPSELSAEDWALAVVQTRAMLAALGDPKRLPSVDGRRLSSEIEGRLASTTTKRAPADLLAIWQTVAVRPRPPGFNRSVLDRPASNGPETSGNSSPGP
jgi:hypothetical protein